VGPAVSALVLLLLSIFEIPPQKRKKGGVWGACPPLSSSFYSFNRISASSSPFYSSLTLSIDFSFLFLSSSSSPIPPLHLRLRRSPARLIAWPSSCTSDRPSSSFPPLLQDEISFILPFLFYIRLLPSLLFSSLLLLLRLRRSPARLIASSSSCTSDELFSSLLVIVHTSSPLRCPAHFIAHTSLPAPRKTVRTLAGRAGFCEHLGASQNGKAICRRANRGFLLGASRL